MYIIKRKLIRGSEVTAVYIGKEDMNYRVDITKGRPGRLEVLSTIFGEPRLDEIPEYRMNAAFFDPNGGTENVGEYYDKDTSNGSFENPAMQNFVSLIQGKNGEYATHDFTSDPGKEFFEKVNWVIAGGFTLYQDGVVNYQSIENFSHAKYRHPRSMAVTTMKDAIILVVVDGRSSSSKGYNYNDLAKIAKDLAFMCRDRVKNAINYDGGGSSEMMEENTILNVPSDRRERSIGSAFVVYKKLVKEDFKDFPSVSSRSGYNKGIYAHYAQRLLTALGYPVGPLDGIIGSQTSNFIRKYQFDRGLKVDGWVGPVTFEAMFTELQKQGKF